MISQCYDGIHSCHVCSGWTGTDTTFVWQTSDNFLFSFSLPLQWLMTFVDSKGSTIWTNFLGIVACFLYIAIHALLICTTVSGVWHTQMLVNCGDSFYFLHSAFWEGRKEGPITQKKCPILIWLVDCCWCVKIKAACEVFCFRGGAAFNLIRGTRLVFAPPPGEVLNSVSTLVFSCLNTCGLHYY